MKIVFWIISPIIWGLFDHHIICFFSFCKYGKLGRIIFIIHSSTLDRFSIICIREKFDKCQLNLCYRKWIHYRWKFPIVQGCSNVFQSCHWQVLSSRPQSAKIIADCEELRGYIYDIIIFKAWKVRKGINRLFLDFQLSVDSDSQRLKLLQGP